MTSILNKFLSYCFSNVSEAAANVEEVDGNDGKFPTIQLILRITRTEIGEDETSHLVTDYELKSEVKRYRADCNRSYAIQHGKAQRDVLKKLIYEYYKNFFSKYKRTILDKTNFLVLGSKKHADEIVDQVMKFNAIVDLKIHKKPLLKREIITILRLMKSSFTDYFNAKPEDMYNINMNAVQIHDRIRVIKCIDNRIEMYLKKKKITNHKKRNSPPKKSSILGIDPSRIIEQGIEETKENLRPFVEHIEEMAHNGKLEKRILKISRANEISVQPREEMEEELEYLEAVDDEPKELAHNDKDTQGKPSLFKILLGAMTGGTNHVKTS